LETLILTKATKETSSGTDGSNLLSDHDGVAYKTLAGKVIEKVKSIGLNLPHDLSSIFDSLEVTPPMATPPTSGDAGNPFGAFTRQPPKTSG
jgi:hypothetical protein